MLTIIFGAGASYDSSSDFKIPSQTASRLPLAKDLFSKRFAYIAKKFPIAFPLINRFRRAPNIEHELEVISTENGSNTPEQLLKIRRYINEVIKNAQYSWNEITQNNTVYFEFIDTLHKWQENIKVPINLITFNYDTLLDTACSAFLKLDFHGIGSYISNNASCKLFKPHGSINWTHLAQMPQGTPVHVDIDHLAKQLMWTPHFYLSSASNIYQANNYKSGYYETPAIAVPTETKTTFEFPNDHKEEMIKAIDNTTCLLSIGWKAEEKHFLKLWGAPENKKKLKKIEVVNSDVQNVNKIIGNITNYGNIFSSDITSFSDGFSNYVPNALSDFLNRLINYLR